MALRLAWAIRTPLLQREERPGSAGDVASVHRAAGANCCTAHESADRPAAPEKQINSLISRVRVRVRG